MSLTQSSGEELAVNLKRILKPLMVLLFFLLSHQMDVESNKYWISDPPVCRRWSCGRVCNRLWFWPENWRPAPMTPGRRVSRSNVATALQNRHWALNSQIPQKKDEWFQRTDTGQSCAVQHYGSEICSAFYFQGLMLWRKLPRQYALVWTRFAFGNL